MNEDEYMDSVEVIATICEAYDKKDLTENQAICHIAGILHQDQIKRGNAIAIIKELCKAYDKRDITKEAALYGILGRLSIIQNLDDIMENTGL